MFIYNNEIYLKYIYYNKALFKAVRAMGFPSSMYI